MPEEKMQKIRISWKDAQNWQGVHKLCAMLPMIVGEDEQEQFRNSLLTVGQLEPIVFWARTEEDEPILIDGRNRRAALIAGGRKIKCELRIGEERDAVEYILAKNISGNRHLTASQRAMAYSHAMEHMGLLKRGGRTEKEKEMVNTATDPGVSDSMKGKANMVVSSGSEDLKSAATQGEVDVSSASRVASLDEEKQADFLDQVRSGEPAKKAADKVLGKKSDINKAARDREESRTTDRHTLHNANRKSFVLVEVERIHEGSFDVNDLRKLLVVFQNFFGYVTGQGESLGWKIKTKEISILGEDYTNTDPSTLIEKVPEEDTEEE